MIRKPPKIAGMAERGDDAVIKADVLEGFLADVAELVHQARFIVLDAKDFAGVRLDRIAKLKKALIKLGVGDL